MKQGYVYVPYIISNNIPIISSGITPTNTIKTRYAQKIVNSSLYGVMNNDFFHNMKMKERRKKLDRIINRMNK